jgi:hypothetical protein
MSDISEHPHVWAYWEQVAARILARHLPPDEHPDSISACDDEDGSTGDAIVPLLR